MPKKRPLEDYVKQAEHLAGENGGVLPCQSRLARRGFYTLTQKIVEFPAAFQHLVQDQRRVRTKPTPWQVQLATVRDLLAEFGTIPPYSWLKRNGLYTIYLFVRRHNDLIQPMLLKGPEAYEECHRLGTAKMQLLNRIDHMATLDGLLDEHDEVLPSLKWLQANGYRKCYAWTKAHPGVDIAVRRESEWTRRNRIYVSEQTGGADQWSECT